MLTKDLIRYKTKKGKLEPKLLDAANEKHCDMVRSVLSIYADGVGQSRDQLDEAVEALVTGRPRQAIVLRGLAKLLADKAGFHEPAAEAHQAMRKRVFAKSAAVLRAGNTRELAAFRAEVASVVNQPPVDLEQNLYGDLPGLHVLETPPDFTQQSLMNRYNLAQVQWLLLHSDRLLVRFAQPDAGGLRQLAKYLRFFQLIGQIQKRANLVELNVAGPRDVIDQATKYGRNLANFFPAILHQPVWVLETAVRPGKRYTYRLQLDQSSGLRPLGRKFHDYVPPEFEIFKKALAEAFPQWTVAAGEQPLDLPGAAWCVPDIVVTNRQGRQVGIELFHRWHKGPFEERLDQLASVSDVPLLIGMARALLKKRGLKTKVADSQYMERWSFPFSEVPVVSKVKPLLVKLLET